eukprot:GHVR01007453.1.p3 GENE.GHVR01007453.1~~GHVR01007453.1.p3  ORF type:complete len:143 (+),score=27.76 GHVR01007453.1:367-795(+)
MAKSWMQDHVEKVQNGEIHWQGGSFFAKAETEVEKTISRSTILLQKQVRSDLIQHVYPPSGPTPGGPPAKRTGQLRDSIDMETFVRGKDFVGRVGTNLKYGRHLELGEGTPIRPYLRPALDRHLPQIKKDIAAAGKRMDRGK